MFLRDISIKLFVDKLSSFVREKTSYTNYVKRIYVCLSCKRSLEVNISGLYGWLHIRHEPRLLLTVAPSPFT